MFHAIGRWLEQRRAIRRRWQADARELLQVDELGDYYAAQRLAGRARADGSAGEFVHWNKVAAEVARASLRAEMNLATAQAIVDEERQVRRPNRLKPRATAAVLER